MYCSKRRIFNEYLRSRRSQRWVTLISATPARDPQVASIPVSVHAAVMVTLLPWSRLALEGMFPVEGWWTVSGTRFGDDPLVSVSERFPLAPAGFTVPASSSSPSGPATRPFGLRWLTEMGLPTQPSSYRYCPRRQVAVDVVSEEPVPACSKLEWTTISHKDGDEGPSKDYDWEIIPDFTG